MRIYLVTLPILLSAMSCSKNIKESSSEKVSIISEGKTPIDLNNVFKNVEIVPLKGDVLIGSIRNIIYSENFFYVHDGKIGDIKVYDKNLSYIKSIDHAGIGPGQYRKIDRLMIRKDGIYVFSNLQASILKYTLDGEFIEKIRLDNFPYQVSAIGNGFLSFDNFNPNKQKGNFNLTIWNDKGRIAYQAEPYSLKLKRLVGYSGGVTKSLTNETLVYYNPPLSDTIHIYNEKLELKGEYLFDGLIKNPVEGGVYAKSFNTELRNNFGHIAPLLSVFEPYLWVLYKDPPYLKTAFVDLNQQTFHRLKNIVSSDLSALVNNVKTTDDDGYFYSTPNAFFSKEWEIFKETALSQGLSLEQTQSEEFQFVVKFKTSPAK